jgi:hypothetical protein
VTIRIAEIDACSPSGPAEAAFDSNVSLEQTFSPGGQTLWRNTETHMSLAACSMRWNGSERQDCAMGVAAAKKEKQYLPPADIQSAETLIRLHHGIAKKTGVKLARAAQIRNVKARFQNPAWKRGFYPRLLRQIAQSLWFANYYSYDSKFGNSLRLSANSFAQRSPHVAFIPTTGLACGDFQRAP